MSAYFVKNLNIARSDGTGVVCAGAVFAFDDGVSSQQKEDVVNSILLAQLASDKKYSRTSNANEWYEYFGNVLQQIGWVTQNYNFGRQSFKGPTSADKIVIDNMKYYLKPSGIEKVQAAVDAMKGFSDYDEEVQIFTSNSTEQNHTNFQVGYCKDENGDASVGIGAFKYHINKDITNPLSSTLKDNSVEATTAFQTMVLNSMVYGQIRGVVRDKLGGYTNSHVKEF